MSRYLAINWSARTLRFVLVEAGRGSELQLLDAGAEEIGSEGDFGTMVAEAVRNLVKQNRAEKARLLVLINRGSVDAAGLTLPPASDAELPLLVQNLAIREIPGASEQTPIDFIPYPPADDGRRTVTAMALMAEDQAVVNRVVAQSGCRSHRVLISTHALRAFVPDVLSDDQRFSQDAGGATLIVSRGDDVADLLMCRDGLPLMSRTIRLPAELPAVDINRYLSAEIQRTLIAAGEGQAAPAMVAQIVVVGNESQTYGLNDRLADQFDAVAACVRPAALLKNSQQPEKTALVDSGNFAALLAAIAEDAAQVAPSVDFANPRRPPVRSSPVRMAVAIAGTVLTLVAGGGYFVWAQFDEIDQENARLVTRLNELNDLVKKTESKRQLARFVDGWEKNRISWPDELRDLTERIPSSPDLMVQQLTISPAGSGVAVATFRGVGKQAETITQMESRLRDKYHDIRIPGVREQQDGNKVSVTFQATLTIRRRPMSEYSSSTPAEVVSSASGK